MKKKPVIIGSAIVAVLALGGTGAAVAANGAIDDDTQLTGTTLEKASKAALAETGEGRVTDSESESGGYEIEVTLDNGSAVDLWLNGSFEVVRVDSEDTDDDADNKGTDNKGTDDAGDTGATGSDDDHALTADERTSAEAAALAAAPGTVTEVERSDDDDNAFEGDITRPDGTTVEVELDQAFAVVHIDEDGADDNGSDDADDKGGSDDN